MNERTQHNRILKRAAIAGAGVTAASVALTVGLIVGVDESAATAASKTTTSTTSGTSNSTTSNSSTSTSDSSNSGSSNSGITSSQQGTTTVAGSNGS
jgi:hypothetical protein